MQSYKYYNAIEMHLRMKEYQISWLYWLIFMGSVFYSISQRVTDGQWDNTICSDQLFCDWHTCLRSYMTPERYGYNCINYSQLRLLEIFHWFLFVLTSFLRVVTKVQKGLFYRVPDTQWETNAFKCKVSKNMDEYKTGYLLHYVM